MREILFRGKMEDGGDWVYGDLIDDKFICVCDKNPGAEPLIGFIDVVPDTIGQYTGIHDKNGNRIFEGDIIRIHNDYTHDQGHFPFNALIGFTKGMFVSYGEYDNFYTPFDSWNTPLVWWEIIGNIYDNPDLVSPEWIQEESK
jgi:uncharacterized phage protein (TIGR01671 family)